MGDMSRWTFNPLRDFSVLLAQQGRVDTDSDRNEAAAIVARRIQAGMLDTVGRVIVPRETPDGFRIEAAGRAISIGYGRMYVDGILVENHGPTPPRFDPHLAERTTAADRDLPPTAPGLALANQPYAPFLAQDSPPNGYLPPEGNGPHLLYLKVWNREVSSIEDPRLPEPALGVDTTTRLQTVWQVRLLANVDVDVDCSTPLADVPDFADAEPPADARLTSKTVDAPERTDPCDLPPSGGYRGLENQLYRIEVHTGGHPGATFKWSRENASVASRITSIATGLDSIVVESIGRDENLGFSEGDWIEITDDWRELQGLPGELRLIRANDGVDAATRTIFLESALPAGAFAANLPERNTRVRRWDQSGTVRDEHGAKIVELDKASGGEIPIPGNGRYVVLENNIAVSFDLDHGTGRYRTGDYWLIAARAATASIDLLKAAPPLGIHAHYAKLAIVTLPDTEVDCRTLWPPASGDDCCDCTVCVSAESHLHGDLTIQQAIESLRQTGGTLCLGIGDFPLNEPLRLDRMQNVRVRGHGRATVLHPVNGGPAILVDQASSITLESFDAMSLLANDQSIVTLRNSAALAVRDLGLTGTFATGGEIPGAPVGAAIELAAQIESDLPLVPVEATISGCHFQTATGIWGGAEDRPVQLGAVHVEDNLFECPTCAVSFGPGTLHGTETRLRGNTVVGGSRAGFEILGGVSTGTAAHVEGNHLEVLGDGIVGGIDGLLIAANDIRSPSVQNSRGDGVRIVDGADKRGDMHVRILSNSIRQMGRNGVLLNAAIASAMIKLNVFADLGAGAVCMEDNPNLCEEVVVENNQISDVCQLGPRGDWAFGMVFVLVRNLDVRGNAMIRVSRRGPPRAAHVGIMAVGCTQVRIESNHVAGLGPVEESVEFAVGIAVTEPFSSVLIASNTVTRRYDTETPREGKWLGIEVAGALTPVSRITRGATQFARFGKIAVWEIADKGGDTTKNRAILFTGKRAIDAKVVVPGNIGIPNRGSVAILGNTVVAEASLQPALFVAGVQGCRVADNLLATVNAPGNVAVASQIHASNATVTSNELRGSVTEREDTVLAITLEPRGVAAVVGNLANGGITLNGPPLVAPWAELNPFCAI